MPYIDQKARKELKKRSPSNPGELNYLFTLIYIKSEKIKVVTKRRHFVKIEMLKLVKKYVKSNICYQTFNDVSGAIALSCSELARRRGMRTPNVNIWHDVLCAGLDVQKWLSDTHIDPYEDAKISENGDVYPSVK